MFDSEKIENNDKIIQVKQSIIDQQEDIINLMRNLNDPSTNNDEHCIQNILNDMFLKYDDVIQRMKNSDVIKSLNLNITYVLIVFNKYFFLIYI